MQGEFVMGQELQRIRERKKIVAQMDSLATEASNVFVIHYSCESFNKRNDGSTPRISSIAVRNLSSGQTNSFSIHQTAEEKNIPFEQILYLYDELEKEMLDCYFNFVNAHTCCRWMHWNMRDVNYGFAAIEHRYRVLAGEPTRIAEEKKFDLAYAMYIIYGDNYLDGPKLQAITKKNEMNIIGMLSGKEEADAFKNKQFLKIHQSTLRKTDVIANTFYKAVNRTLKTNSSWLKQHGYTIQAVSEKLKNNWLISLAGILVLLFTLGAYIFELLAFFKTFFGIGSQIGDV